MKKPSDCLQPLFPFPPSFGPGEKDPASRPDNAKVFIEGIAVKYVSIDRQAITKSAP
jgi:hypothetical protein